MKTILSLLLCFCISTIICAQALTNPHAHNPDHKTKFDKHNWLAEDSWHMGPMTGIAFSKMLNYKESSLEVEQWLNTKNAIRSGAMFGFFAHYKPKSSKNWIWSFQQEILYRSQGGKLRLFTNDDHEDLINTTSLKFDYMAFNAHFKLHHTSGGYILAGPQYGFILNRSNISFVSADTSKRQQDLGTSQTLKEALSGKDNFSFGFGIGYEHAFRDEDNGRTGKGFFIDVRYNHGIKDVLQTFVNGIGLIDAEERNKSVQLSVGFSFAIQKQKSRRHLHYH